MDLERRALYNLLRMNSLHDANVTFEPWQVEDYRHMTLEAIFGRLKLQDIDLNKSSFLSFSEAFDTPEELSEKLLEKTDAYPMTCDQVYLLVFELWRRLVPEKPSFSIFCDELDAQIFAYDSGKLENSETLQDALANLAHILDENVDNGADPSEIFETIRLGCGNDIESFLYDFISEQIDARNDLYALELLDNFSEYVSDVKWFDFLRAKLLAYSDKEGSKELIHQLLNIEGHDPDLEFNLEVLGFLVFGGEKEDFINLAKKTIPLLQCEEDFQDLLTICADFYHRLDQEPIELTIQDILKSRSKRPFGKGIDKNEPDTRKLFKVMV